MALSIDFQDSVSFLPTIQATRLLTLASAGLTPAEYTSLSWTWGNGYWSPPPIKLHNAYDFETVTIYYRWHPLFGLSLPVRARRKDGGGERIYCESDGRIYSLPGWMLSPECLQFSLGPAVISTEALSDLHDLLASLPLPADCDKAGLNSSPKEGLDETTGKATLPANESSAIPPACHGSSQRAAERTDQRSDGTTNQRGGSKEPATWKRSRG